MDLKRLFTVTLVAILLFALTGDHNYFSQREVVVAQLVERSLLTPEVLGFKSSHQQNLY